jgi:mono/diheme cytochrome c family protein
MRLLRRLIIALAILGVIGAVTAWFLSAPRPLDAAALAAVAPGDAARGERVFNAGGCSSCHARPGSPDEARLELAGGLELNTPFGVFVAPNISPHPQDGIGGWSFSDLASAMKRGVSPDGSHYYPAFPYTSYTRMDLADIADLHAYMQTLPAVAGAAPAHRLGFPFNIRRAMGLWKLLFLSEQPVAAVANASEQVARGRYLVEGPGHCGECHTPRNPIGGTDRSRWLGGAPAAEGSGTVPNISPAHDFAAWTEADIANLLESGFTPEFDSVGGQMALVVKNMARLPAEDRAAIAAYLKAIPPVE